MHTRETDGAQGGGLGAAAKQVAEHASALARLELELATAELKRKVAALGMGAAFGVGALVLLLYALGFGLASLAAGLGSFMDGWLALLVVCGVLVLLAVVLAMLALKALKRGTPPVPEQAIEEAKRTTEALRRDAGTV